MFLNEAVLAQLNEVKATEEVEGCEDNIGKR